MENCYRNSDKEFFIKTGFLEYVIFSETEKVYTKQETEEGIQSSGNR